MVHKEQKRGLSTMPGTIIIKEEPLKMQHTLPWMGTHPEKGTEQRN